MVETKNVVGIEGRERAYHVSNQSKTKSGTVRTISEESKLDANALGTGSNMFCDGKEARLSTHAVSLVNCHTVFT